MRHRGTIGGSVSHGDPASDLGTILLTLDAEFVAQGPDGERTIPAAEFFTGPFETALGPQEILTEMRVPKVDGGVYLKHVRRAQDWATVGGGRGARERRRAHRRSPGWGRRRCAPAPPSRHSPTAPRLPTQRHARPRERSRRPT